MKYLFIADYANLARDTPRITGETVTSHARPLSPPERTTGKRVPRRTKDLSVKLPSPPPPPPPSLPPAFPVSNVPLKRTYSRCSPSLTYASAVNASREYSFFRRRSTKWRFCVMTFIKYPHGGGKTLPSYSQTTAQRGMRRGDGGRGEEGGKAVRLTGGWPLCIYRLSP